MIDQDKIKLAAVSIIEAIGEDPNREGLRKPSRVNNIERYPLLLDV